MNTEKMELSPRAIRALKAMGFDPESQGLDFAVEIIGSTRGVTPEVAAELFQFIAQQDLEAAVSTIEERRAKGLCVKCGKRHK